MRSPGIWCVRTKFRPRISVDRARKAMHRFGIAGIYCSRYILISIGNLVLTGFGNLDRPYLILLSGHQLTAAAALSCCSREKNTIGNAIRSRQWPFTLTDNAFRCASSQKLGKLAFNIFISKTTGFCIGHVITIIRSEPRALRISKNFRTTYLRDVYAKIAITLSPMAKAKTGLIVLPQLYVCANYIHMYIYVRK